jgi:hypothetical protein
MDKKHIKTHKGTCVCYHNKGDGDDATEAPYYSPVSTISTSPSLFFFLSS